MEETDTGEVLDAIDAERAKVVACAREQIGNYQRKSREVREMIVRVMPSLSASQISYALNDPNFHWCGVAALSAYHLAGITDIPWIIGRGFALGLLPKTENPQPGDLFIGPAPAFHHGIVIERYTADSGEIWLKSVEGNTPICCERNRPEPKKLTYYSIEELIRKKLDL